MLANTPRQQAKIGMGRASKFSKRLTNRSMVHGSNALLLENKYSSLRNSPSGQYLAHPRASRVPDHPAEILSQMR